MHFFFFLYFINAIKLKENILIADSSFPVNSSFKICCSFLGKLTNISIFQRLETIENRTNKDEFIVHISPKITSFARIAAHLQKKHFKTKISDEIGEFNIVTDSQDVAGSKKIEQNNSLFNFLNELSIPYNVYSDNCKNMEPGNKCSSIKPNIIYKNKFEISKYIFIIILASLIFIHHFKNNFFGTRNPYNNFWLFDSDLNTILKPENEDKLSYYCIKNILKTYKKDRRIISEFYKISRKKHGMYFYRLIIFPLKNNLSILFPWFNSICEIDKTNINVEFNSDKISIIKEPELTVNSLRTYSPFEVNLALDTRVNVTVRFPFIALESFQPFGEISTFLSSMLLYCSHLLKTNPSSDNNFKKFWDRHSKIIKCKRVFIKGTYVYYEMNSPDILPLTKEQKKSLIKHFKEDDSIEIYDDDLLPDCKSSFFQTITNAGNIMWFVIGFDHSLRNYNDMELQYLPLLIQSSLFIFHICYASEKTLKFQQINSIKKKHKILSIFEADASVPVTKVLSQFTANIMNLRNNACQPNEEQMSSILEDIKEMYKDPSKIIIQKPIVFHGLTQQMITVSAALIYNKYSNLTVFTAIIQDMKLLLNQVDNTLSSLKIMRQGMYNVFEISNITLLGEPHLEDSKIMTQLGYSDNRSFMSIVHPDDQEIIKKLTLPAIKNKNGQNTTFSDIAQLLIMGKNKIKNCNFTKSIYDIIMEKADKDEFLLCPEKNLIKVIGADNSIHFMALFSYKGIGCIFCADPFVTREDFPRSLFHYSPEPKKTIFWAVDMETESVMPLFGMPTIWDELIIDKMTKFSMLKSFIHESGREKFEDNLHKLLNGEITSWTESLQILRIGGSYQWYLIAIYASSSQLHCALLNLGDEYDSTAQTQHLAEEKSHFMRVGKFYLFKFRDDSNYTSRIEKCDFTIENVLKMNWKTVERQIASKYRDEFIKKMTNAFEYGHTFEMDFQIDLSKTADDAPELHWISMRGKLRSPTEVAGICIDIDDLTSKIDHHMELADQINNTILEETQAIKKNAKILTMAKGKIDELITKISPEIADLHQRQILEAIISGSNRLAEQMKSITAIHPPNHSL